MTTNRSELWFPTLKNRGTKIGFLKTNTSTFTPYLFQIVQYSVHVLLEALLAIHPHGLQNNASVIIVLIFFLLQIMAALLVPNDK